MREQLIQIHRTELTQRQSAAYQNEARIRELGAILATLEALDEAERKAAGVEAPQASPAP